MCCESPFASSALMPSLARLIRSPGKTLPSKGEVDATWWTMTDLPRITKLTPTRLLAIFVTSTSRTMVGLAAGCLSAKNFCMMNTTAQRAGANRSSVTVTKLISDGSLSAAGSASWLGEIDSKKFPGRTSL